METQNTIKQEFGQYRAENGMRLSSLEAHEEKKPSKEFDWQIIVQGMQKCPDTPLLSRNIAKLSNMDYHATAKRLSEMEKEGMVKVVGRAFSMPRRPLLWILTNNYKNYETNVE
ncbi:MAG: hypothetical protein AAF348_18730 [Bacteroidota bacterium]